MKGRPGKPVDPNCWCGAPQAYQRCCGLYHSGAERPPTAEALMRARYSAFVLRLETYLWQTWAPEHRPGSPLIDPAATQWLGLEVKACQILGDNRATVEFVVRFKQNGRAHRLHERSDFERRDNQWLYLKALA